MTKPRAKYIIIQVTKTSYHVGRMLIGKAETYVTVCICKDEHHANLVMEALAFYEERIPD